MNFKMIVTNSRTIDNLSTFADEASDAASTHYTLYGALAVSLT